eukprot:1179777-Prorocentrum_minimum.AAC.1
MRCGRDDGPDCPALAALLATDEFIGSLCVIAGGEEPHKEGVCARSASRRVNRRTPSESKSKSKSESKSKSKSPLKQGRSKRQVPIKRTFRFPSVCCSPRPLLPDSCARIMPPPPASTGLARTLDPRL